MAIGAYFLPLGIVIVCYVMIVAEVRRSERKFARKTRAVVSSGAVSGGGDGGSIDGATGGSGGGGAKENKRRKKEVQIAKVIFMVIVCWAVAWTPYLVVSLMGIFFWREMLTPWTSQIPALFAKSGSVYNPASFVKV
nr:rhabdomeric opsin [Cornechiniscus lobatus]